jgi:hypothetical protein
MHTEVRQRGEHCTPTQRLTVLGGRVNWVVGPGVLPCVCVCVCVCVCGGGGGQSNFTRIEWFHVPPLLFPATPPPSPSTSPMLTIQPSPRSAILGARARVRRMGAWRFVSSTRCQSSTLPAHEGRAPHPGRGIDCVGGWEAMVGGAGTKYKEKCSTKTLAASSCTQQRTTHPSEAPAPLPAASEHRHWTHA